VTEILLDYERPGKSRLTYRERLLGDLPDCKVLSMNFTGKSDMVVNGQTILEPGSPMVWFIFPGKWYDIGRFYLTAHTFTGLYTNICTPVLMQGSRWSTTDLFLDLWIPADGGASIWLDQDAFEDATTSGVLSRDLAETALRTRNEIDALHSKTEWPPEVVSRWNDTPA
jgi:predicted RNA-binding protein associated with RNAse of E/G family